MTTQTKRASAAAQQMADTTTAARPQPQEPCGCGFCEPEHDLTPPMQARFERLGGF